MVWLALLPMMLAALMLVWPRFPRTVFALGTIGMAALIALAFEPSRTGVVYTLGNLAVPLGIALRLDALCWAMLALNAAVFSLAGLYAAFWIDADKGRFFWPLTLFLWGSLNALCLSADLFNLYVTLELVTLAAVALVAVEGSRRALKAALGYLFAAWAASLFYLLGVGVVFAQSGTLDLGLLFLAPKADGALWLAGFLMMGALLLKAALFPLHFWLPSAHGAALTPVSALLSAAAIKGPFYLFMRVNQAMEPPEMAALLLGILGSAAIVYGGVMAWRSVRIKTLIAYSTVSQAGYFFLIFALGGSVAAQGGLLMVFSHALAKATLFLAAGNLILISGGHTLSALRGTARAAPLTLFGAALAAISLAGLPPTGGFAGKWLMLQSALGSGQWFYAAVLIIGSLLAMGYLMRLLGHTLGPGGAEAMRPAPVGLEWTVLIGGLLCLALGFTASAAIGWVEGGFNPSGLHLAVR